MAITKNEIMEWIDQATMMDISELVQGIEEKYGVTAAAAMPMAVAELQLQAMLARRPRNRRNSTWS